MNALFSKVARAASTVVAHPSAFLLAALFVVGWAATGPALHFSENWQLVINTTTTILTFLMIFLLQNTQNRDTRAIHVKLDELLCAIDAARNELVDLEDASDEELERYYAEFKAMHLKAGDILQKKGRNLEEIAPRLPRGKAAKVATVAKKKK